MTFSDGAADAGGANNTCSGGNGLGCHATGAPDWDVAFASTACLNCHTDTTTSAVNPTTGLHAGPLTISGNPHDGFWKEVKTDTDGTGDCMTCHTASPSTGHQNGTLSGAEAMFATDVQHTGGATPTCGPNNTFATCHDDGGAWRRTWSTTARNSNGTECDNCHGMFKGSIGTGDNTWVSGISLRHSGTDADGDIESSHGGTSAPCYQCHSFGSASTYYSPTTNWARHRDGSIQLNNQNQFLDNGATVGCKGCHVETGGTGDEGHEFQDTRTGDSLGIDRWGRALIDGPAGDCTGCHSSGTNGAPIVMTWWAGSAAGQDGGHGDPDGFAAVGCSLCHDLGQPTSPASAGHAGDGSGTYNSIWANDSTRSTNTSHLKAEFFTKYPAVGAGDWSVQVAMDNYCTWECHDPDQDDVQDAGEPAKYMRHKLTAPSPPESLYATQFGRHLTPPAAYPNPDNIPDIPIDVDLNTNASPTGNYAPCVSCHDPHGTGTPVPPDYSSNRMLRFRFPPDNAVLCSKCHR